jgi:hypothetical protein
MDLYEEVSLSAVALQLHLTAYLVVDSTPDTPDITG